MWRFHDERGRTWDVAVGRESWGVLYAIFMERGEGSEVRQVALEAVSHGEAAELLDALSEEGWDGLFGTTLPKEVE